MMVANWQSAWCFCQAKFKRAKTCRCIVEQEILAMGYAIYGWRQVPADTKALGQRGNGNTRPEIEQIMFSMPVELSQEEAERQLFVIRRRIEKAVLQAQVSDFYVCSLSTRSIIYKGMFLAEQVTAFYPDLLDERFVSNCCLSPALFNKYIPNLAFGSAHSAYLPIMVKSTLFAAI